MEERLTERERRVLAWDDTPEEWEYWYGGQYGIELIDAERKLKTAASHHPAPKHPQKPSEPPPN